LRISLLNILSTV